MYNDTITNALGSEHFNPDQVVEVLAREAANMQARGENPGSLWAVANLLPELTEQARQQYQAPNIYMNKAEFSEAVFLLIKSEIESRGFALWHENFDASYPISLRAIWNIRKGQFKVKTLNTLPGIRVDEWFTVSGKLKD